MGVVFFLAMRHETSEERFRKMTETPVRRLILTLQQLYNAADTFFVGQISTAASAAVGVALSLQAVIQAIGFFFGQGSGNNMSRQLGSHHEKTAEILASTGFFSSLIFSLPIYGELYHRKVIKTIDNQRYTECWTFGIILA